MELKVTTKGSVGEIVEAWVAKLNPALAKIALQKANDAGSMIAEYAYAYLNKRGIGHLAKSFLPARFVESSQGIAAGALSDEIYAGIQNDGGTILPKTTSKLAVPLTPQARKMWPRDWSKKDLTLIVGDTKAVLCSKVGDKLKAQYALVSSVTIKGTHYIDHAADKLQMIAEGETPGQLIDDAFEAVGVS